jgi:hypothetical protein
MTMPLSEVQKDRVRAELAREANALRGAAPPERQRVIRMALERAGVQLTWDEWVALEPDLLPGADGQDE